MRKISRGIALSLLLLSGGTMACSDLLNHSFRPLAGKEAVKLCDKYDGKVLLVVNVASKCGNTPQYAGLEKLHSELNAKGFAVLGFPANDFMSQEPGTEKEIQEFCTLTYGVKFPMFEKTHVKGKETNPLFAQLTKATGEEPDWNFHKYLIGKDGKVIKSYGARTKPDDAQLRKDIDAAMAAK
jgi:glutathione peroxidase